MRTVHGPPKMCNPLPKVARGARRLCGTTRREPRRARKRRNACGPGRSSGKKGTGEHGTRKVCGTGATEVIRVHDDGKITVSDKPFNSWLLLTCHVRVAGICADTVSAWRRTLHHRSEGS